MPFACRTNDDYEKELNVQGYTRIAGIDEAGRGPLCGPVVAAAVVLPSGFKLEGLTDSKLLSPSKRDFFFDEIRQKAEAYGIAAAELELIDKINILEATRWAMVQAIAQILPSPDFLLIDAVRLNSPIPQKSIIKGDLKCISIAAASILAKVSRDRMMMNFHQQFPQYNFASNKGYPTKEHRRAISLYGPCPLHRKSFRGVKEFLDKN